MSKSEINDLVSKITGYRTEVITQGKEKIGDSKAINVRVKSRTSGEYMDIYIVVSDKHVLLVDFLAKSEAELDNAEFIKIKRSFKMKEKTTNVTVIRFLEFVIIVGGIGFVIYKNLKK